MDLIGLNFTIEILHLFTSLAVINFINNLINQKVTFQYFNILQYYLANLFRFLKSGKLGMQLDLSADMLCTNLIQKLNSTKMLKI